MIKSESPINFINCLEKNLKKCNLKQKSKFISINQTNKTI